jgi:hypothetical protein
MVERQDKADAEALMNSLLGLARKLLCEQKGFLPFGGHMKVDGTIAWEGANDGREHPPSRDLMRLLWQAHRRPNPER